MEFCNNLIEFKTYTFVIFAYQLLVVVKFGFGPTTFIFTSNGIIQFSTYEL